MGHTHVVRDAVVELADYALPLCGLGECGQLEGADALPPYLRFPGLGHVERHANEAVGAAPQSRKRVRRRGSDRRCLGWSRRYSGSNSPVSSLARRCLR